MPTCSFKKTYYRTDIVYNIQTNKHTTSLGILSQIRKVSRTLNVQWRQQYQLLENVRNGELKLLVPPVFSTDLQKFICLRTMQILLSIPPFSAYNLQLQKRPLCQTFITYLYEKYLHACRKQIVAHKPLWRNIDYVITILVFHIPSLESTPKI